MIARKKIFKASALLLWLSCVSVTFAAQEMRALRLMLRATESVNAPVTETVTLYNSSYALVIGIDQYIHGWPKLSNAVRDAELVAEELRSQGSITIDQVVSMYATFFDSH